MRFEILKFLKIIIKKRKYSILFFIFPDTEILDLTTHIGIKGLNFKMKILVLILDLYNDKLFLFYQHDLWHRQYNLSRRPVLFGENFQYYGLESQSMSFDL